jgi:hypothetical protein
MAARYGFELENFVHPWKRVPVSLVLYQLNRMFAIKLPHEDLPLFSHIGLPINLFDAMRVILRKPVAA